MNDGSCVVSLHRLTTQNKRVYKTGTFYNWSGTTADTATGQTKALVVNDNTQLLRSFLCSRGAMVGWH